MYILYIYIYLFCTYMYTVYVYVFFSIYVLFLMYALSVSLLVCYAHNFPCTCSFVYLICSLVYVYLILMYCTLPILLSCSPSPHPSSLPPLSIILFSLVLILHSPQLWPGAVVPAVLCHVSQEILQHSEVLAGHHHPALAASLVCALCSDSCCHSAQCK